MSCGSEDCGCGCQDLVQVKRPLKKEDAEQTSQATPGTDDKKATSGMGTGD